MYGVSEAYKSVMASPRREWSADISLTGNDDLMSVKVMRSSGNSGKLVGNVCSMEATLVYLSEFSVDQGSAVEISFGLKLPDNSIESVPLPEMYVEDVSVNESGKQTVVCYDNLQKTRTVKINQLVGVTYPIQLSAYIGLVAELCGLEVAQIDASRDITLTSAPNLSGDESAWDVLGWAAEAMVSNLIMNRNNQLAFVPVVANATPVESISPANNYFTLKTADTYGPVNTIVLGRYPQEDNVYYTPSGVTKAIELRIDNNPFLDYGLQDSRYGYIDHMFGLVNGIQYTPYDLNWITDPALDVGDMVQLELVDGSTINTYYFDENYTFNGFIRGTSSCMGLTLSDTDYGTALTEENLRRQTYLMVDKVNGRIESLVQEVENIGDAADSALGTAQANSTLIQQVAQGLTVAVSTTGGNNLLKGTSGRQGILDWTLSEDGSAEGDTTNDTTSGGYLRVTAGQISQSFRMLVGQQYAYCYKYRLDGSGSFSIAGIDQQIEETDIWHQVQGTFTAQSQEAEVIITPTSGSVLDIADLIVVQGAGVSVWRQAPNEVITATMTVDDRGTTWSKEGNPYEAHADNTQFEVRNKDTNTRIAYMDKDGAQLYNTTIKNQFTLQREETTSSALRIIPVTDGAMFVIND